MYASWHKNVYGSDSTLCFDLYTRIVRYTWKMEFISFDNNSIYKCTVYRNKEAIQTVLFGNRN